MEITTERPARSTARVGHRDRWSSADAPAASTPHVVWAVGAAPTGPTGHVRRGQRAMGAGSPDTSRPTRGVHALLAVFCALTAAAVVSLLVLADRTEETFAWTIEPPVTAAFLGSGYAAGFVLAALGMRSGDWREVRVPFVTVLVFVWITTGATFFHLHRLHVQTPGTGPVAVAAAWLWLAVYVVVPVVMAALLPRQPRVLGRARGRHPAVPLPRALTVALLVEGLVLTAVGMALVVRCLSSHGMPADHTRHHHAAVATDPETLWPWTLSPLACGVIAAWLLAFAVAIVLCVADGDLARLGIATRAYTAFGVLQMLTLVRFRDDVAWSRPAAWVFVVMTVAVTATGAAGWLLARCAARGGLSGTCLAASRRSVHAVPDNISHEDAGSTRGGMGSSDCSGSPSSGPRTGSMATGYGSASHARSGRRSSSLVALKQGKVKVGSI